MIFPRQENYTTNGGYLSIHFHKKTSKKMSQSPKIQGFSTKNNPTYTPKVSRKEKNVPQKTAKNG